MKKKTLLIAFCNRLQFNLLQSSSGHMTSGRSEILACPSVTNSQIVNLSVKQQRGNRLSQDEFHNPVQ